jgi:DNA polymerase-3 subunit gamma/tau
MTDGALARAPEPAEAATGSSDLSAVREAVAKALAADGHATASMMLGAGVWTMEGSQLKIEVAGMGKKMLALTVNAAAEKIIRQELVKQGAPTRFMVVPGAAGAASGPGPAANVVAGSVQEAALAHPLVQRAKEIFNAEVRSIVDLRTK